MLVNYLNKALDIFSTPIVTTVYYVLFTMFVMIASGILFKEFNNMSIVDIVGLLLGFATVLCAIFLIRFVNDDKNNASNQDVSLKNALKQKKKKPSNVIEPKTDSQVNIISSQKH